MALLLIMDRDHTHADPVKDARACYKLGDIVEVMDDAKHDGNIVANPIAEPFYMIRVTGVTAAQILTAIEPDMDAEFRMTRRRKYRLILENIPATARNTLQTSRYLQVTRTQAGNYIRHKTSGARL